MAKTRVVLCINSLSDTNLSGAHIQALDQAGITGDLFYCLKKLHFPLYPGAGVILDTGLDHIVEVEILGSVYWIKYNAHLLTVRFIIVELSPEALVRHIQDEWKQDMERLLLSNGD